MYSIKQVADLMGVGRNKVAQWIHEGEMEAVNVSHADSSRPQWRITDAAIDAFNRARSNRKSTAPSSSGLPEVEELV